MIALAICALLLISACAAGPVGLWLRCDQRSPRSISMSGLCADAPDPADRAGAAANYVDCVHDISNGGWSVDFGPGGSASELRRKLSRGFSTKGSSVCPPMDMSPRAETKVASCTPTRSMACPRWRSSWLTATWLTSTASDRWNVETFATCDPAEYDPTVDDQLPTEVWLDADGNRVPTSIITSFRGADHVGGSRSPI